MNKNMFYVKLTGFFLAAFTLAGMTYIAFTLLNSLTQSDAIGWLWLSGLPILYYFGVIVMVGLDITFVALFIGWIAGRNVLKKQEDKETGPPISNEDFFNDSNPQR